MDHLHVERWSPRPYSLGHTSAKQLDETLAFFNPDAGRLPEDLMWAIDCVHMQNRLPIFSSDRVQRDWEGTGEIGERIP